MTINITEGRGVGHANPANADPGATFRRHNAATDRVQVWVRLATEAWVVLEYRADPFIATGDPPPGLVPCDVEIEVR